MKKTNPTARFAAFSVFTSVTLAACFYTPPGGNTGSDGGPGGIHHSFFRGRILAHEVTSDGLAIAQGDMILGPADRMEAATDDALSKRSELTAINGANFRWPNGVIPYVIAPGITQPERVTNAINHWNSTMNGVIHLVPRTSEANYVQFEPSVRCASYVGMIGGLQSLFVSDSSTCPQGSVIHEIGHAVGAFHEHSRNDRDQHIKILWQNIDPAVQSSFDKTGFAEGTDIGAYDYGSIMHYGVTAGSMNGQPTIETIPPGIAIGQRNGLSAEDITTFASLYGTGGGTTPPTVVRPSISIQPYGTTVSVGGSWTFSVTASGSAPLNYQWYQNLTPVGVNSSQLALSNIQLTQAGSYWVRVSNSAGTMDSTAVALVVLSGTPDAGTGHGTSDAGTGGLGGSLVNNVPLDNLSGAQGSELRYTFVVPSGATNLQFQISGGTGDVDLYVSLGSPPNLTNFGCRPYLDGNSEACSDRTPAAGTYFVLLSGYTSFSGVRLMAQFSTGGGPGPTPSAPPTIVTPPAGLSINAGGSALFTVVATTTSGTLTYQWFKDGSPIYGETRSQLLLNNVQTDKAGLYYVQVTGSGGTSESIRVPLIVNVPPPHPQGTTALANGVPVDVAGTTGTELTYTFDVPNGVSNLSFRLSGGSGDANMYVKLGEPALQWNYDCGSWNVGNEENCSRQNPPPGTYNVMLHLIGNVSGAKLVATYSGTQAPPNTNPTLQLNAVVMTPTPSVRIVTLTWNSVGGGEYYEIYRDGVLIDITYDNIYYDPYLPPNFRYTYQVMARVGYQVLATSNLLTVVN